MLKKEPRRLAHARTFKKDAPTDSIGPYTFKSLADDFVSLAKQLGCVNIIVGGHDWGCMIAYRMATWHPDFVTHMFTACVPYLLPNAEWVEIERIAKIYPTFGYQLQFGSGVIEQETQTKEGIRKFLNSTYDGRTSDNQSAIDATMGIDFDLVAQLEKTALLSEEELEYYVNEFARNGLHGACNYYRNHRQNFLDDSYFTRQGDSDAAVIKCPTLFLCATEDKFIRPEMTEGIKKSISNLTFKKINASHWILWEKPGVVNGVLREWFWQEGLVSNSKGA
ncbi:predicted protein [Aspergillus terreus NIH2624]|uniref:AB hydrolase-1 domain-containing protein n=1 Tax=Aspergillus terreus (strain NIH 2624 / FGSC A1156) TaxID=341663 RepID=Q0C8P3_ASPTN|nr:uncharacterized protein ATEG_09941 [Aspergillus terreus NIH2624]EAU30132.1 predicted protein [Aspergillus terreus NIH2624]